MLFGEHVTIELHFTVLGGTDIRIPNPLLEDAINGIVHLGHPKSFPVWYERDCNRRSRTRMFFDFWGVTDSHVLRPRLGIGLLRLMVLDDHRKVCGVDVRQLGTIAVATTDDTLLGIIIIGTREEVSKDEFRIP